MFEASKNGRGPGGFLAAARGRVLPALEPLEGREVPAVIGGIVYHDVNRDGLWQPTEVGLPNNTLTLLDASSTPIAATTSDGAGHYQFTVRNITSTTPAQAAYSVNFDLAKTDVSRSATLPQFDSSLGQLTSVDLIAQGSTATHVVMENMDDQSAAVQSELHADIRYNVAGTTLEATPQTTQTATLGGFDGQADLKGSSSKDFGIIPLEGTFHATTLTDPAALSAFVGTGTVNITQDAKATACSCGPGNLLSMVSTKAQGSVKVVYHYTPSNLIGPGQYTVVQTQPPGFTDTFNTADNITPLPPGPTDSIPVTVHSSNDQLTSNNFGEVPTPVPIAPPDTAPPPATLPPATLPPATLPPSTTPPLDTTVPSKFFFLFNL